MGVWCRATIILGCLALAGCGSTPTHREWTATGEGTATAAYDECDDQVDTLMRLRGYPVNPLPETPQFQYRKTVFAQCMRRKGYEAE
ncbi:hypothetical protein HL658_22325 [Azospirillum sp. RWY-5-1]|uniref:Lipoprotein n=1 Tax=Azospirillum oleiclasticum TaxID=2735135 RepID=A0ABX2TAU4_9PROT|nr:hypothetical protein [Azospirillum oleiclasticum]NYZ15285.1 hypothetical protein [Azospirillum oleiclasticum]NYZ21294.1 hypothetical protein [Azospirillum oleiclasticum]